MNFRPAGWLAVILILMGGISCDGADRDTAIQASPEETAALIQKGKPLFLQYCAHCHGVNGDGDGFNAEYLDKEPAELADQEFISKKTNEQIYRVIKAGGAGVKKSHLMPVFGNTLSEKEIWSLVVYVRKLAEDDSHPLMLPRNAPDERPKPPPTSRPAVKKFTHWMDSEGRSKENLELGEKLFKKKKSCFACHRIDGEGGKVGPDLSRAGFYYSPEWLYAWITNPQEFRPHTEMPAIGFDLDEVRAIAAYLNSLHDDGKETPEEWSPYLNTKGDPRRGEKLFSDPEGKVNCSKCHRVWGKGEKLGPDLSFIGTSRKVEFILESILDPKAVITSGYATVLILTKEKKFITGIKKNEDASSLEIVDKDGQIFRIDKDMIKKYKIQKISTMPANFKDLLEIQEVADILAYMKTLTLPEISGKS